MEFPPPTRRQVREALDLAADPDIAAAYREDAMRAERDELDQIMAEVDRELATEARTETRRIDRAWMGERHARRAARRAEHAVIRSLPVRLDAAAWADLGGEAA